MSFSESDDVSFPIAADRFSAEWRDGLLRDLAVDGRIILRAAGFLLRTRAWDTVPASIAVTEGAAGSVQVDLRYDELGCYARARLVIRPAPHALELAVEAEALAPLEINRIGLVALLPMPELSGARCCIEHTTGAMTEGTLPAQVAMPPVYRDIRALAYQHPAGLRVRCVFGGDSFEMEDQRVFSDASLKVYSRSNALPRPIQLQTGERVAQTLRIEWSQPAVPRPVVLSTIPLLLGGPTGRCMPDLGIACNPAAETGPPNASVLAASGARFIHLNVSESTFNGVVRCITAARDIPVAVTIDSDDPAFLARIAEALRDTRVHRVALGSSSMRMWDAAADCFGTELGIAAPSLIELLRVRAVPAAFRAFETSAIIHDADSGAVMASNGSLPAMIEAAAGATQLPVHVGPSAIALSRHPHSRSPLANAQRRRLPMAAIDPRSDQPFAAAWAVDFLIRSMIAASVTLFTDRGPLGILSGAAQDAASAFRALAGMADQPLLSIDTSGDDRIAAIAVQHQHQRSVIIANRTSRALRVALASDRSWHCRSIDGAPFESDGAITLEPYMVVIGRSASNAQLGASP